MELPPTADALPDALVERDQWVCWRTQQREDKQTKVPIVPETTRFASTTKPDTWRDFQTAREAVTATPVDGIGFVFTADDPLIGVDLDSCRDVDTDEPTAWASQLIDQLDSYTEVSPSGTGYHILCTGTLPEGRNRAGDLEIYDRSRFFTVTGEHVADTPTTAVDRTAAIKSIHAEEVAAGSTTETSCSDSESPAPDQSASTDHIARHRPETSDVAAIDDEDLLDRARNAANGGKFSRLWNGDTSGYESHSEADMALCQLLAFWTGCDRDQMDRLFRQSGLSREKWDAVHYADGTTYGAKTITRAISRTDDVYTPPEETQSAATAPDDGASGDATTASATTTTDAPTASASPTHADASSATVSASQSAEDTASGSLSETARSTALSGAAQPQVATDQCNRIDELTSRVESLMEENEALRADLAAERSKRKELERERDSNRIGWWPF